MMNLQYIDLYEDGIIQRRVSMGSGGSRKTKQQQEKLRKSMYEELRISSLRSPEKIYWMELKTNN